MLLSHAQLVNIKRQVGSKPDEGLFRIERRTRVTSGAGTKEVVSIVDTVSGRQMYVGDLNPEERQKLGIARQDVKYMMTLEAHCDVQTGDTLIAIAPQWQADTFYFAGQRIIPTAETIEEESGKIYLATLPGLSGATEPEFPSGRGQTVTELEGEGVAWFCSGPYLRYDVLALQGPSTFGDYISRRVQCNLEQNKQRP